MSEVHRLLTDTITRLDLSEDEIEELCYISGTNYKAFNAFYREQAELDAESIGKMMFYLSQLEETIYEFAENSAIRKG